jgi:hypothetical protein
LIIASATLVTITCANLGCTTPAQRTFASPDDAVQSLVAALRSHDTKKLEEIFGPDSDDILFSGDPVDDQLIRTSSSRPSTRSTASTRPGEERDAPGGR